MSGESARERGIVFKVSVIGVFLLLFALFATLFIEVALRFYYRDVLSTADGTSYFSLRNQHLFNDELNGWRFRGKHFNEAPDERYRLVVTGDSFTFGQGTYPAAKRFTERMDLFLNAGKKQPDIEVINIGICGFDLTNHYKFLHFVDAIKPDYVLYQWYVNDMVYRHDPSKYLPLPLIKNKSTHTWLWQHSALYYMLQRWYGSYQLKTGPKVSYQQYLTDLLADPEGKPARNARRVLLKLIDHYKEKNLPFGIVLFPSFYGPMDQYKLGFLHEQVLKVCSEKDVQCLDLRDKYRDVDNKKLWANDFDPHPSALAHEIAADAIDEFFGPFWMEAAREKSMRHGAGEKKNSNALSGKK